MLFNSRPKPNNLYPNTDAWDRTYFFSLDECTVFSLRLGWAPVSTSQAIPDSSWAWTCLCLELSFSTLGPAPESPVSSQLTVEFHHPGFGISVTGQAHSILVISPASVPPCSSPRPQEGQRNCQETRLRLVFGATSPQRQQFLLCDIKSRSSRELLMPL